MAKDDSTEECLLLSTGSSERGESRSNLDSIYGREFYLVFGVHNEERLSIQLTMSPDIDELDDLIAPTSELMKDNTEISRHIETPISCIASLELMISQAVIIWITRKYLDRIFCFSLKRGIEFFIVLRESLRIDDLHIRHRER